MGSLYIKNNKLFIRNPYQQPTLTTHNSCCSCCNCTRWPLIPNNSYYVKIDINGDPPEEYPECTGVCDATTYNYVKLCEQFIVTNGTCYYNPAYPPPPNCCQTIDVSYRFKVYDGDGSWKEYTDTVPLGYSGAWNEWTVTQSCSGPYMNLTMILNGIGTSPRPILSVKIPLKDNCCADDGSIDMDVSWEEGDNSGLSFEYQSATIVSGPRVLTDPYTDTKYALCMEACGDNPGCVCLAYYGFNTGYDGCWVIQSEAEDGSTYYTKVATPPPGAYGAFRTGGDAGDGVVGFYGGAGTTYGIDAYGAVTDIPVVLNNPTSCAITIPKSDLACPVGDCCDALNPSYPTICIYEVGSGGGPIFFDSIRCGLTGGFGYYTGYGEFFIPIDPQPEPIYPCSGESDYIPYIPSSGGWVPPPIPTGSIIDPTTYTYDVDNAVGDLSALGGSLIQECICTCTTEDGVAKFQLCSEDCAGRLDDALEPPFGEWRGGLGTCCYDEGYSYRSLKQVCDEAGGIWHLDLDHECTPTCCLFDENGLVTDITYLSETNCANSGGEFHPEIQTIGLLASSCFGSGAEAELIDPCGFKIIDGGSGYAKLGRVEPTITVSGGSGSGANFTVYITSILCSDSCFIFPYWVISHVSVTGGTGYIHNENLNVQISLGDTAEINAILKIKTYPNSKPTLTASATPGSGAIFNVIMSNNNGWPPTWKISEVRVSGNTSGYIDNAPLTFSSASPNLNVIVSADARIKVLRVPPSITATISGLSGGNGASLDIVLGQYPSGSSWYISQINIINAGNNYPNNYPITFTVTDGVQTIAASANIVVQAGVGPISGINILNQGSYHKMTDQIDSIVINNGGVYYNYDGIPYGVFIYDAGKYYREETSETPYVSEVTFTSTEPAGSYPGVVDDDTSSPTFGQIINITGNPFP